MNDYARIIVAAAGCLRPRAGGVRRAAVCGCALVAALAAPTQGQVTVLSETFEGLFPEGNGWVVGDANPNGPAAYWDDVNFLFGGEGPHSGGWKGYSAGSVYPANSSEPNPTYQPEMRSFMRRSINLAGYAGAELRFWYKIPSMDNYFESLRVSIDGTVLFARDTSTAVWSEAIVNLSAFVGGNHTLSLEFNTDNQDQREGCYLDDIVVLGYMSPPNDAFASAIPIGGAMGSISGFNLGATKETSEPDHAGNPSEHSIWYRWTASSGVSVDFNTSGSDFDTMLAIYVGGGVGTLVEVSSNDDIFPSANRQSRVRFTPTPSTTYWIAVDGFAGQTGNVRLNWQQGGVPDLIIHGPSVGPSLAVLSYAETACEVVEGLIAPGTRKVVRFTTEARNVGSADLWVGDPAGNPLFTPGLCHTHNHFNNFVALRVRDSAGNAVVTGGKIGFCLEDLFIWDPGANPTPIFSCGYQGLQRGWSDTYRDFLPGQWVDITGLPAGNYFLEQEINPIQILEESNYGNNVTQVPFTIAPYSNNEFVNATRLANQVSTVTGNNTSASKEPGEPNHANNTGGRSIWYCWTAGGGAGVAFDTQGSNFDTLLAVYTGHSVSTLKVVVENDDIDGALNRASRVAFFPTPGTTYWIAVDGYNGASGSVVLNVSPANNDFSSCRFLEGEQGSEAGFNFGATTEVNEPFHAGRFPGPSVWYCWTAPVSGLVEFNTFSSDFDTLLAVYTGSSINSLVTVASNDDLEGASHRQSRVIFTTSAGTDYRIAVDGYAGATGEFSLNWGYGCRVQGTNTASGRFIVTLRGVPRETYSIEGSDDLVHWVGEREATTGFNGVAARDMGHVSAARYRFYRAALVP